MARDRRAKFVEIAQNRVRRAIDQLRLIGNLANKSNYDYTEEDARKIVKALQGELDALKAKFSETRGGSSAEFTL